MYTVVCQAHWNRCSGKETRSLWKHSLPLPGSGYRLLIPGPKDTAEKLDSGEGRGIVLTFLI